MAKELKVVKYDPNTEAFQMRAQWKKADVCRNQWFDRWSWLFQERDQLRAETDKIRRGVADSLPQVASQTDITTSLKPVPVTSTGVIGWLAKKPECKLEIYTSWLTKIPLREPDAWNKPGYYEKDD